MAARLAALGVLVAAALAHGPSASEAADWFVAPGGVGNGTAAAPFGRIQDAVNAAQPGDSVILASGTYAEAVHTARDGSRDRRIVIRAADGARTAVMTARGRVLTVSHAWVTVDGLVLDGQYGPSDILKVDTTGHGFTLRRSEVRRTSRDAIDMAGPRDVVIEDSLVHHALNAAGGRTDAHGIAAGPVQRLTIRNTEVHTFSGDAFQVDPGRFPAGWNDVLIEGCRFWLAPLAEPQNGFPAGVVPGENAVDTKVAAAAPRARITIRNTVAHGFRKGLIANMAAFNLKENIEALVDGVTVFDSRIAFRMRGPGRHGGAGVRVQNAVIHDTDVAFRYEDDIETPRLYNVTLGARVARPFDNAASPRTSLDVRNLLLLGGALPPPARGPSNRAVPDSAFVDAARHDYRLRDGSPAIDAGVGIAEVTRDRAGTTRPQGRGWDVGAYEREER